MNLGLQTHRNGLEKTRRWSQNTSQIQTNVQTCLDVVKENPPKKPSRDPRRLASNSRLAVSLGACDSIDDDSYDDLSSSVHFARATFSNSSVPRILCIAR